MSETGKEKDWTERIREPGFRWPEIPKALARSQQQYDQEATKELETLCPQAWVEDASEENRSSVRNANSHQKRTSVPLSMWSIAGIMAVTFVMGAIRSRTQLEDMKAAQEAVESEKGGYLAAPEEDWALWQEAPEVTREDLMGKVDPGHYVITKNGGAVVEQWVVIVTGYSRHIRLVRTLENHKY